MKYSYRLIASPGTLRACHWNLSSEGKGRRKVNSKTTVTVTSQATNQLRLGPPSYSTVGYFHCVPLFSALHELLSKGNVNRRRAFSISHIPILPELKFSSTHNTPRPNNGGIFVLQKTECSRPTVHSSNANSYPSGSSTTSR